MVDIVTVKWGLSYLMQTYLVAAKHSWNKRAYERCSTRLPGHWALITNPAEFSLELVRDLNPRYIFFPHWSAQVSAEIVRDYECVCFHMTDVPYGRGGSPLQNLIARDHKSTKLTALRMTENFDEGPVYQKRSIMLDGAAHAIFERVALLTWDMIADIVEQEPVPLPQVGIPVVFKRRRPDESCIPERGELVTLFDHIRMLDADGYPRAYLNYGGWTIEFRDAEMDDSCVKARVKITSLSKV